jgi:hypothetical protein
MMDQVELMTVGQEFEKWPKSRLETNAKTNAQNFKSKSGGYNECTAKWQT